MPYSRERTLECYGPAIEATQRAINSEACATVPGGVHDLLYPASTEDPAAILSYLEHTDPTAKNAFVLAMVRWFVERSMRYLEDAPKSVPVIHLLQRLGAHVPTPDLKRISFGDFLGIAEQLLGEKSSVEIRLEYVASLYASGEAIKHYEDDDLLIVIPKSIESAQHFGRNTRWCTSATYGNEFEGYDRSGDLYILILKKQNVRWQFHFESNQFMDSSNKALPLECISPYLRKYFTVQMRNSGRIALWDLRLIQ